MSKILMKTQIILFILISSFVLTACVGGLPNQEKYEQLISGAVAHYGNDLTKFYSIKTLTDNTEFNTEIEKQPYEKIELKHNYDLEIKAIVFLIRSSEKTTFNFDVYTDEFLIFSTIKQVEKDEKYSIELFFNSNVNISKTSQLFIKISEPDKTEEDEKTSFVFDTLFVFLNEE